MAAFFNGSTTRRTEQQNNEQYYRLVNEESKPVGIRCFEELSITKNDILNNLYNIKKKLFCHTSFVNYVHFYEIHSNLKNIIKYEKSRKGNPHFLYTHKKKYFFLFTYIIFLLLNLFFLFRLQTIFNFATGYSYYYTYEINFQVFFTFFVFIYCLLNIYLLICSYKFLSHHIDLMCNMLIQTLYNTYIKEKNKEIYANTEMLINECKSVYPHLEEDFGDAILLYADNIFNKFVNIFRYISKGHYEYKYEKAATLTRRNRSIVTATENGNYISDDKAHYISMNKNMPGTDVLFDEVISKDVTSKKIPFNNKLSKFSKMQIEFSKNMNFYLDDENEREEEEEEKDKEKDTIRDLYKNRNNTNIYNIYGNSIYSDIYDLRIYLKLKYNHIHSLILHKSKSRINYIKFAFYFFPYLINFIINIFTNLYVIISVYYYHNIIPLASTYELSTLHIIGIFNSKGIYYILFIFFINFTFFLYVLFLNKFNTLYMFLRQIYSYCKYESISYCDNVMNHIYEKYIFEEIANRIYNSRIKITTHQTNTACSKENVETQTQPIENQKYKCQNTVTPSPKRNTTEEKNSTYSAISNFKCDSTNNALKQEHVGVTLKSVPEEYQQKPIPTYQNTSDGPYKKCSLFGKICEPKRKFSNTSSTLKNKVTATTNTISASEKIFSGGVKTFMKAAPDKRYEHIQLEGNSKATHYASGKKKNKFSHVDCDITDNYGNRNQYHIGIFNERLNSN